MWSCNRSLLILDIGTSGFEEGIRDMKPGGKRRIIIPPELGPPVSYRLCLHNSRLELIYFICISIVTSPFLHVLYIAIIVSTLLLA